MGAPRPPPVSEAREPFTVGLIRLLTELAAQANIPVSELLQFEELEISKDSWRVKHSLLGAFIANMVLNLDETLNRN